ncbi:MAG TPA: hypothetical protein VFE16_02390 [Candidatus Cybelea sp.]|nr:hypothetical protein [Candidatus Cybelea sp.]
MQLLVHQYRDEVGRTDVDMHEVSEWAVERGYLKPPKPVTPMDLLAKEFAKALREETKVDPKTRRAYRVNHARMEMQSGKQITLWGDIDRLGYEPMLKCFVQRRNQTVGEVVQQADDIDHWNRINPNEPQIKLPFDFGPDIEWHRNAPGDMAS